MDNYGTRLKDHRKLKGLTQNQAAELLNVPQQTYQRYEEGRLDLKMSTITNICKGLQMSSDHLLGLEEDIKSNKADTF